MKPGFKGDPDTDSADSQVRVQSPARVWSAQKESVSREVHAGKDLREKLHFGWKPSDFFYIRYIRGNRTPPPGAASNVANFCFLPGIANR